MERLDQLKAAQDRVETLQAAGTAMTSREARRAVNRLVTLIRGTSAEELRAFDAWKRGRQTGRSADTEAAR